MLFCQCALFAFIVGVLSAVLASCTNDYARFKIPHRALHAGDAGGADGGVPSDAAAADKGG